ncbi:MAG: glycine/betaine/sarcosine/D-proline family reductase selenoprotein B [Acidiferrobacterales bacterium]|nr:glycine/betaine/sarcosine/D-proline family reductase selenoprotein B [Acidiferrobacterales bacterium]
MVRLADIPEPERSVIADLDCPAYQTEYSRKSEPAKKQHVAIVSTAGLINRGERPLLARDTGYRQIASEASDADILCSHVSTNFDRTGFQQDINVMLPRDRLNEFAATGKIGKAADVHYAFMGATHPDALIPKAQELAGSMLALGVNTVVLAPV